MFVINIYNKTKDNNNKKKNNLQSKIMLQHQQQSSQVAQGYYDYNQPSPGSITNPDSLNNTPFSVKDILNMVNQNEDYESYGTMERWVCWEFEPKSTHI